MPIGGVSFVKEWMMGVVGTVRMVRKVGMAGMVGMVKMVGMVGMAGMELMANSHIAITNNISYQYRTHSLHQRNQREGP